MTKLDLHASSSQVQKCLLTSPVSVLFSGHFSAREIGLTRGILIAAC